MAPLYYMFSGTTNVISYDTGSRLPPRFRYFDMISASRNFLLLAG